MDVSKIPDAIPKQEPRAATGNKAYTALGVRYTPMADARGYRERGVASWYGKKFHGRPTSSREPYDMYAMTAAHKTLPLPSYVRVRNLQNGRAVVVRVNDRGPFLHDRVIDLSYAAAHKLGIVGTGTGLIEVEAVEPGGNHSGNRPHPAGDLAATPSRTRDYPDRDSRCASATAENIPAGRGVHARRECREPARAAGADCSQANIRAAAGPRERSYFGDGGRCARSTPSGTGGSAPASENAAPRESGAAAGLFPERPLPRAYRAAYQR